MLCQTCLKTCDSPGMCGRLVVLIALRCVEHGRVPRLVSLCPAPLRGSSPGAWALGRAGLGLAARGWGDGHA
eukprot:1670375-Alexandrium_andersonii.AAC.1